MKQIVIHLGDEGQLPLTYEFYDNPVANIIWERMQHQENKMVERDIFKGFGETVEELQEQLQQITDELKTHMDLEFDDVLDTNTLHINFPKYNDLYLDDPVVLPLLRKFNRTIHHIEQLQRYPHKSFQFACIDSGVDFQDEWYNLFQPYKRKGEMYMHYPHVGKHFFELFMDNDVDVLEEQIVLTNKVSNTFSFWCGEDIVFEGEKHNALMWEMQKFYNRIADKLPYEWGDPKLAIGYVPIGRYVGDIYDVIQDIDRNKYVHSWSCLYK